MQSHFIVTQFKSHESIVPTQVDIGDMSRNWKSSEAILLDDSYTWSWHYPGTLFLAQEAMEAAVDLKRQALKLTHHRIIS